jgi:hypothetical protein
MCDQDLDGRKISSDLRTVHELEPQGRCVLLDLVVLDGRPSPPNIWPRSDRERVHVDKLCLYWLASAGQAARSSYQERAGTFVSQRCLRLQPGGICVVPQLHVQELVFVEVGHVIGLAEIERKASLASQDGHWLQCQGWADATKLQPPPRCVRGHID